MPNLDYASLKTNGRRYRFATFMAIAAFAVGLAIDFNNGEYFFGSLALITAALILAGIAMASPEVAPAKTLERTLFAAVGLQLVALLLLQSPSADLTLLNRWQLAPFYACVTGAGLVVAGAWLIQSRFWQKLWFPLLLSMHLLASLWIVHLSSNPKIDVWVFQQEGARELLHGGNPYERTFPDIYHSTHPGNTPVYGSGLVVNDRVQFGFPYPPVSLLLSTAGYWLGGDHRYAQAFAASARGHLRRLLCAG